MAGPQNVILGDEDYGTSLPETQVDDDQLKVIQNLAKFSKTREFQKLKEHLEQRIEFYQTNLPGGSESSTVPDMADWVVANKVIAELKAIIQVYEGAAEEVKNARRSNT